MTSDSGQRSSKRSKSSQGENFGCYLPDILGYAVIPAKVLISLPVELSTPTPPPYEHSSTQPTTSIVTLPLGTSSLQSVRAEVGAVSSLAKHAPSPSLDSILQAVPVSTTTNLASMSLPRSARPAPSSAITALKTNPQNETSGFDSKTVFATCEIKPKEEQAQERTAREWCYLSNAFRTCGSFIGLVIIRFRLAVCLMLDEGTIIMETTDQSSWGKVERVAEVRDAVWTGCAMFPGTVAEIQFVVQAVLQTKRYDKLPHLLADEAAEEPIIHAGWIKMWNVCALAASLVSDLPACSPLRRHEIPQPGQEDDERWKEIRDLVKRSRTIGGKTGEGADTRSINAEERSTSSINNQTRLSESPPSTGRHRMERVNFKSTRDRMFTYAKAGDSSKERKVLALHDRIKEDGRWRSDGEEMNRLQADFQRERTTQEEDVEEDVAQTGDEVLRLRGGVGEASDTVQGEYSASTTSKLIGTT